MAKLLSIPFEAIFSREINMSKLLSIPFEKVSALRGKNSSPREEIHLLLSRIRGNNQDF